MADSPTTAGATASGGGVNGLDPLTPVLTRAWLSPKSWRRSSYEQLGGYSALKTAVTAQPEQLVEMMKSSGLRGRGGAGFPTGLKWSFLPPLGAKPRYLVVNGDESEPGTCKDIPLMMADPHLLVEGCIITSFAIRSHYCVIYIRGELIHPIRRVRNAVREAYSAGYLGKNILGTGFDLDIVVHAGAGAYICGEETALLSSLEGFRGQPRLKPPFPAVEGLYASPTVVNNVETIASVPSIVSGGVDWYRKFGTDKSPGTKIFSLSGHIERPGQYEAPLGTTLRQLIDLAGGMKDGIPIKFWTPGGSSVPLFGDDKLDVPLDYDDVAAAGSLLGTTALQIFNQTASVPWAVARWADFYRHESCGKCAPCREGTAWMSKTLRRIITGHGTLEDVDTLEDTAYNIFGRAFCALGDGAATSVSSAIQRFRQEFVDMVNGDIPAPSTEAELIEMH